MNGGKRSAIAVPIQIHENKRDVKKEPLHWGKLFWVGICGSVLLM